MLKHFLAACLSLLLTSCVDGGSFEPMECNPVGYVDLDATWKAYAYKHTLVTWPDSGKTEVRESEGLVRIVGDQCGSYLVFFGALGQANAHGAKLHLDIENTDFNNFRYVVTGYGYVDQEMGWMSVKTDYGWVTYDTDWTFDLIEKRFE